MLNDLVTIICVLVVGGVVCFCGAYIENLHMRKAIRKKVDQVIIEQSLKKHLKGHIDWEEEFDCLKSDILDLTD